MSLNGFKYVFVMIILAGLSLTTQVCIAQEGKAAGDEKTITVNVEKTNRIIIETGGGVKKDVAKPTPEKKSNTSDQANENPFAWQTIKKRAVAFWHEHDSYLRGFTFYTISFLVIGIIATLVLSRFARWLIEDFVIVKFAHKTRTDLDEMFCNAIGRPTGWVVNAFGFYLSVLPIVIATPGIIDEQITLRACLAVAATAVAWGIYRLIEVIDYILTKLAQKTDNNLDDLIVAIIRKSLKVIITVISVLFIGQNILGLNITALLAGAGVAGLAIAFAAQDTIANFFGSIMIILDRPFKVGDRIDSGGVNGTVEHVGFRSTRLRTLTGHAVTVPNKNLASNTITNISERPYIKQEINLTLVYDTTPEQMERAIEILHEILDNQDCMDMENKAPVISFNSFNDWALNIVIYVWYFPADWGKFMLWYSQTNLAILKRFNAEGLEFAFPTNTTYLADDPNRRVQLTVNKPAE